MSVLNPKFYDGGTLKVAGGGGTRSQRADGPVPQRGRPVATFARSVRDTCAVIVDAIRGRYDR